MPLSKEDITQLAEGFAREMRTFVAAELHTALQPMLLSARNRIVENTATRRRHARTSSSAPRRDRRMIDDQLGSMREAQFRVAEELAARGWPAVFYTEVMAYPAAPSGTQWLALLDLSDEMHGEIQVRFSTSFKVDVDDDAAMARFNVLFWRGCKTRVLICGDS
jgi:hypothetical protein